MDPINSIGPIDPKIAEDIANSLQKFIPKELQPYMAVSVTEYGVLVELREFYASAQALWHALTAIVPILKDGYSSKESNSHEDFITKFYLDTNLEELQQKLQPMLGQEEVLRRNMLQEFISYAKGSIRKRFAAHKKAAEEEHDLRSTIFSKYLSVLVVRMDQAASFAEVLAVLNQYCVDREAAKAEKLAIDLKNPWSIHSEFYVLTKQANLLLSYMKVFQEMLLNLPKKRAAIGFFMAKHYPVALDLIEQINVKITGVEELIIRIDKIQGAGGDMAVARTQAEFNSFIKDFSKSLHDYYHYLVAGHSKRYLKKLEDLLSEYGTEIDGFSSDELIGTLELHEIKQGVFAGSLKK